MGEEQGDACARLLIVSPYSIVPPIHGGAVRMANLIRQLSRTHEVLVLVMIGGTDDPEQRRGLVELGARPFFQQFPEAADHPGADGFFSPILAERIAALAAAHRADVVQLEYTELGRYVRWLSGRVPVVLVEHDIAFRSLRRRQAIVAASGSENASEAERGIRRLRRMEIAACRAADMVHLCSGEDLDFLATQLPDGDRRLRVVANGVDVDHFAPPEPDVSRRDALFVGSFPHVPNIDALKWLVERIWPTVRRKNPSARLTVVGARPPSWVEELDGSNGIAVAGEVQDVAPFYREHRVMLAPIRAGSGTRLKILEAMASGIPVVSTTVGAEGLAVENGKHLLIADDEEAFATSVLRLLKPSQTTGRTLAAAAREHVTKHFGWQAVAEAAAATYAELVRPGSIHSAPKIVTRGTDRPEVSIIVHGHSTTDQAAICLDSIAEQQDSPAFEVIWASPQKPQPALAGRHRFLLLDETRGDDTGAIINRAVHAACSNICVVLAANARPTDDLWLSRLVAPFAYPNPPAAVSGSVRAQRKANGRAFDPWFTAESRSWGRTWGDTLFSVVNGAFRREVWESFPLPMNGPLAGRRWQRQLHLARQLVQPCLDAAVCLDLGRSLELTASQWTDEGHAWKDLGLRYHLGHVIADLLRCTGLAGTPRPGFPFQLLPYLRPVALWVGGLRDQP